MTTAQEENKFRDLIAQSILSSELEDAITTDNALMWLAYTGAFLPPWWSRARDRELRRFWVRSDHLSGAIYAMISKLTTIPYKIIPVDQTISRHIEQAEEMQYSLLNLSGFAQGWNVTYGKFLLDYFTQDNGGFLEIIGDGRPDGPIVGPVLGIAHLDSARCQRTSNPEYPVLYHANDGSSYKLHYTRVIEKSALPSADARMHGVGFCAVSRSVNTAQHLIDIATFEQEKLGSRPLRAILVGSNISADKIAEALAVSNSQMDTQGLSRYSRIPIVANRSGETSLNLIDLASLPDGFDKDISIRWGMAAIALAFGVDYRELWPATVTGATKADASIQHMKARLKGIGEILQFTERVFNQKVLPRHLRMVHDFQDDEEDLMRSQIRSVQAGAFNVYLNAGMLSPRVMREQMLEYGIITQSQFEQLELEDGRLEDGSDVLSLFLINDREMAALVNIGVSDPLDLDAHDPADMVKAIDKRLLDIKRINVNTGWYTVKKRTRNAMAALTTLRRKYEDRLKVQRPIEGQQDQDTGGSVESLTEDERRVSEGAGENDADVEAPAAVHT